MQQGGAHKAIEEQQSIWNLSRWGSRNQLFRLRLQPLNPTQTTVPTMFLHICVCPLQSCKNDVLYHNFTICSLFFLFLLYCSIFYLFWTCFFVVFFVPFLVFANFAKTRNNTNKQQKNKKKTRT